MTHWLWFALISLSTMSIAALFQRLAMREDSSDPITSSIIFQILLSLISATVGIVMGFHLPELRLLPYFILSGILYAAGTYCFFRAAKLIEASEISIITGVGTIVPILVSFVVLSERFSLLQWIGAGIVIASIIFTQYEKRHVHFNTGVLYALGGTIGYGIAVVFDGLILRSYDTFSYIPIISLIPGLLLMMVFPKKLAKLMKDVKRISSNLWIYSILYVIGAEMFYFAVKQGAMVSQLTTIMRASIIITVAMAIVFLGERSKLWKKLVGALLTTLGIMLLR